MRIVIDTNVLISGAFFSGTPSRILDACISGLCEMAVSPEILQEYSKVGFEFSKQRPSRDFESFLALLLHAAILVQTKPASSRICRDPDDDKFFHCALASGATQIISGDKHLLEVSGHGGVHVIRPRQFYDGYLEKG